MTQARDNGSTEQSGNCREEEDFYLSNWKGEVSINNNWQH